MNEEQKFKVGDRVIKDKGDYVFDGIVVSAFRKTSAQAFRGVRIDLVEPGPWRYVAQNEAGILHVFGAANLKLV